MLRSPRGVALLVAIALALIFLALADEAREKEFLELDHAVHTRVQSWRQPALEAPMRALSTIGSGKVMIPFVVLVTALLWRRGYRNALMVPVAGIAAVAIEV